jgi:hypothetical protein
MWRALSPASQLIWLRVAAMLVLIVVWSRALSPQAVWPAIALISCGCGAAATLAALIRRDPIWGPSLTRWDEAAACFALQCVAQFMMA